MRSRLAEQELGDASDVSAFEKPPLKFHFVGLFCGLRPVALLKLQANGMPQPQKSQTVRWIVIALRLALSITFPRNPIS
jgi:hypothetical protein